MCSIIVLATLLISFGASTTAKELEKTQKAAESPVDDLTTLCDDLAFGLYANLGAERPGKNLLFSPLGLVSALVKLARLSHAHTRSEILDALGLGNRTEAAVERALSALRALETSLAEQKVDAQLDIQTTLPLNSSNQETGEKERPHQVERVPSTTESSDKVTLTNIVHFKGKWEQPFDSRQTVKWRFQAGGGEVVEVPMMFRDDSEELRMLYDTNCSTTVVGLPYSGRLASLLLLPRTELRTLELCLSISKMNFWLSNLKTGLAEIRFPKFAMKKLYTLESLLKSTGVQSIFSKSANLADHLEEKDLDLSQALHEVELVVDETKSKERGTSDVTLGFSEPHRIVFDRPFIIIVYDEITGFIVLIGKILDPTEE
ncbi:alpha-1-antitrypsin-like protein CM55-MS [Chanos chanos]|uniref:Alpha-1-antitrypsin-like protein CM55-MS n=1 Tax=Chanos chanos TaxID=29144 RepID=A0A6J2V5L4_CHACN|nr:alpha-1-antitrypsin-like protein CM55-MS [Chanos chanos]